jgi:ribulose-5-phosphate 4-epimerase/fuculose-1-phosphate aldolase
MNLNELCIRTAQKDLVRCSSGNASERIDGGAFEITISHSWLEQPQTVICWLNTGEPLDKNKHPSSEKEIHRGIYNKRPDLNSVLHFQSVATTTIACMTQYKNEDFFVIPEIPYYIKKISYVDYFRPGSEDLTNAVVEEFKTGSNLVIARNHGIFLGGTSCEHAFECACFFDLACSILLQRATTGEPFTTIRGI